MIANSTSSKSAAFSGRLPLLKISSALPISFEISRFFNNFTIIFTLLQKGEEVVTEDYVKVGVA